MSTNAKSVIEKVKAIGVTTKVADLRNESKENKTPVKLEENKQEPKKTPILFTPSPSADARIKNLENFSILAGRYKNLQGKMDELQKFNLAIDGSRLKLTLSAGDNVDPFKVANTETLKEVIKVIFKSLEQKILLTEKEIQEFTI